MTTLKGVKVLLLEGFGRQVMPMMQALYNLGCHITTYNNSKLDLGYASRYPNRKLLAYWNRNNEQKSYEALMEILRKDKYDIVIPMTDYSATMLSRHKSEISNYAAPAVNDWDTFIQAADKQNTMIACMNNGIPCPYTLRDVETIDDILNSGMKYPFVIKPRIGYGSIGFHRIDNEAQPQKRF